MAFWDAPLRAVKGLFGGNQQKKKKDDQQAPTNQNAPTLRVKNAPTPNVTVQTPQTVAPQPQQPTNIFETLNKSLTLGKPNTTVPVFKSPDVAPVPTPQPGMVVKPTVTPNLIAPNGQNVRNIPDTPEQVINRGLDAGKSFEAIASENNFKLDGVKNYANATRPDYGIKLAKPKQSFGNRIRDVFDANTPSDMYRRQEGNKTVDTPNDIKPLTTVNPGNIASKTPIVGHIIKTINTLGAQGGEIPSTIEGTYYAHVQEGLTNDLLAATKRGDRMAAEEAKHKLDLLQPLIEQSQREQDAAHTNFTKNNGGFLNAGTLYGAEESQQGKASDALKDIVIPTATTMLDLYTLGQGNAVSEGVKESIGKLGVRAGVRAGIQETAPNIIRAGVGNYASGDISARGQGATGWDPIKAGVTNAALSTVGDVGLPAVADIFKSRILSKLFNGRFVKPAATDALDLAGVDASAAAADQALRPRPITVGQNIPIDEISSQGARIPVRTLAGLPENPGNIIREIGGDARQITPNADILDRAAQIRRASADAINAGAAPDKAIEGVTPRAGEKPFTLSPEAVAGGQKGIIDEYAALLKDLGEGNGVDMIPDGQGGYKRVSNNVRTGETAGKRMTKAMWRDEAERQLAAGGAESGIQKAFDDAANPEVQSLVNQAPPTEAPIGRPIAVKEVKGINVTSDTAAPLKVTETPNPARVSVAGAPAAAEAAVVAQAPTGIINKQTQDILNNPKQYSKRQVAAARNQRKLATQLAKAKEGTAEAASRVETASPAAASGEGFTPTGEFGKSVNGGSIEKVSRTAEMAKATEETANMSPQDVIQTARTNQAGTGGFNRRDIRNIAALFENKRLPRGSAEWKEARQILKEDGTIWGQTGALRNYTMRKTASADELTSRFESKLYRLAEDPTKIDGKIFDNVEAAHTAYTQARDDALAAYNEFTRDPSSANTKLYHAAQDAADAADKAAKEAEYTGAKKALKGNKDIKQMRELDKMANEAGLYQMDAVDASMLSGTGTFVRNFVNSATSGAEEAVFGGAGSRGAKFITKENVGGGFGKGTLKGFGEGVGNLVDASKARAKNAGWNPLEHIKNWSTTGNELGDTILDSQVKHNVIDHYTQILKDQGFSGRELVDRAGVMARQDPNNLARDYAGAARVAAGLGQGVTRGNKIETLIKNGVSDAVSAGRPTALSEATGKLVARMTVGFPTAIIRSGVEGVKRFTFGAPTFIKAIREPDLAKRALLIKEGIKQAGTGAAIAPLFYALGASGAITGSYPTDPEEQAKWKREGITENSVKIDGNYYQLPGYLGAWAVPGLFYASLGRNGGDFKSAAEDTAKIIPGLLPTDQASNIMDVVNGRTDFGKFMAQTGASTVRAVTPAGSLLNQVSKAFDPTANDTNSGTNLENFVNKVLTGIPGQNKFANIPAKEDDAGNPIANPSALPIFAGASSTTQGKGEQRTQELQGQVDSSLKGLNDTGALKDKNITSILDDKETQLLKKVKAGKKVDQSDVDKLQAALTKGVSSTGDDTAYLEREQYDSNLTALKLKRQMMNTDKSTKPSDLKKVDTAITRGQVYKENKIPYDMITSYQKTSVDDWRKMGIPPGDKNYDPDLYDPEMYQKLLDIDQKMTKAGASYNSKALDKNKYSKKEDKNGNGSETKSLDTSFGTLKAGTSAPTVQQYQSIDAKSGSIPIIQKIRPNIVHNITSSG